MRSASEWLERQGIAGDHDSSGGSRAWGLHWIQEEELLRFLGILGYMGSPWADTKRMVTTAKHPLPLLPPHISICKVLGWWEPKTPSSTRNKSTSPVTLVSRNRF